MPYQWKVLPFGLTSTPRLFTSFLNPYCSFAVSRVFHVVIYLDDMLVLVCSKHAGKRALSFCALD